MKKGIWRDLHHISWKNHGIDQYISDALKEYLKKINKKNIEGGINTFNKTVQTFGDSMDKLSKELNQSPKNNVKVWSDKPENDSQKSKDQVNLEKIWGKRK